MITLSFPFIYLFFDNLTEIKHFAEGCITNGIGIPEDRHSGSSTHTFNNLTGL